MSALAGTGALARLILRRDRVAMPLWLLLLIILPIATASAFAELYPTASARETFAATIGGSPALTGLLGPLFDPSIGGLTAWRVSFVFVGAALASLLTVVRHTRAEEEAGRRELLGATVVGRHAPLTAALSVTFGANLLLGLLVAGGLIGLRLPVEGSLAFGLSITAVGSVFASIAGVTAQLTESAGGARGLAGLALGLSYTFRFAADVGESASLGWLAWLSPIGWAQRIRPYGGERWWIFALAAAFALVMAAGAYVLSARRDIGAGVLPTPLGPATAPRRLRTPLALAWRLHLRSLFSWTLGFAAVGAMIGGVTEAASDILNESPQLRAIFESLGGRQAFADAYIYATTGILALVASIYAVQATLRLRSEELNQRVEPLLATSVSRLRLAFSHLVFPLLGSTVIISAFGGMAGLVYGLSIGEVGEELPRILIAALAYLPSVWVFAGLAMALVGMAPRLTSLAWALLTVFFVFGQLGELLRLNERLLDLSPFSHVPNLLVSGASAEPLVWLSIIAAVLSAGGLAGFRRRDIG